MLKRIRWKRGKFGLWRKGKMTNCSHERILQNQTSGRTPSRSAMDAMQYYKHIVGSGKIKSNLKYKIIDNKILPCEDKKILVPAWTWFSFHSHFKKHNSSDLCKSSPRPPVPSSAPSFGWANLLAQFARNSRPRSSTSEKRRNIYFSNLFKNCFSFACAGFQQPGHRNFGGKCRFLNTMSRCMIFSCTLVSSSASRSFTWLWARHR
jgi:hypothetical protein